MTVRITSMTDAETTRVAPGDSNDGAGLGAVLFGTANLWLSGQPGVARSIEGAIAGGILGVELYKHARGIRLERLRDFGDVWLAWGLWRLLELDTLLAQQLPPGGEDVPWATVAAILTIARFCEPTSELHIEHTWYRRTALDDLLGVPVRWVTLLARVGELLHDVTGTTTGPPA